LWATKAAKTRAVTREIKAPVKAPAKGEGKARKSAAAWIKRRTDWVPAHGKPEQYAGMLTAPEVLGKLSTKGILAARELQKEAHAAYMSQGKHGGGHALQAAGLIRNSLGAELAAVMPQLWWYH